MHFGVLVEDRSGELLLDLLLPKILGPNGVSHTWRTHAYKGIGRVAPDLHKNTDPGRRVLLNQIRTISCLNSMQSRLSALTTHDDRGILALKALAIPGKQPRQSRGDALLTSYLTVGEVLTKPRQAGLTSLERSYLHFFTSGAIQVVDFGMDAAQRYAGIRSRVRIRPADAIQLACAAAAGTDLFVTNDARLSGIVVPGVTFVTSLGRIPY